MSNIILEEQAAPSTPSTGQVVIYPKTDGLLYGKDDAGTETQLSNVGLGGITLGTEQASTSGTSIDFTSIPSGTKRIIIMFIGVSGNGTSIPMVQIGDSGGVEATGYSGAAGVVTTASAAAKQYGGTGFELMSSSSAAATIHGHFILTLEDSSDFTWAASGLIAQSDGIGVYINAGSKALSAELDRVRITHVNGSDTFDAGAINIQYE